MEFFNRLEDLGLVLSPPKKMKKVRRKERCVVDKCRRKVFCRSHCVRHYKSLPRLRTVKDGPLWSYVETKNAILNISDPFWRMLFTVLYVLGNRKSEIKYMRKKDFKVEAHPETKKKYLIITSEVKKNKTQKSKMNPINIVNEHEFFLVMRSYHHKIENKEDLLFESPVIKGQPISNSMIDLKCKEYFGFNPHWFRKLRTTHELNGQIPNTNALPSNIVKRFRGWSDDRPIKYYEKWRYMDTAKFV